VTHGSGTSLIIARIFLIVGLGVGLLSWRESVGHIGNPDFRVDAYPLGATHSWYHVFREVCGDAAKMAVFLLLFFGSARWRTPVTWWIGLVLMLGYYAPFWIGEPFLSALSAPNTPAAIVHIVMALFTAPHCLRRVLFSVQPRMLNHDRTVQPVRSRIALSPQPDRDVRDDANPRQR
jgi:hypothetical protein